MKYFLIFTTCIGAGVVIIYYSMLFAGLGKCIRGLLRKLADTCKNKRNGE